MVKQRTISARLPWMFALVVLALLSAGPLAAQEAPGEPLKVAIKPLVPFVIYNDDGSYSGFSIDLWQAIASRTGLSFNYVPLETVTEVLDQVRDAQADVGIAGISITREREEFVDFSQPMFNAGLQIMTSAEGSDPGLAVILQFFNPTILIGIVVMIVATVVVGHFVWLVERNNPDFPDAYLPGVGEGIWWAAASLIGAGEQMPRSIAGRVGAFVWVILGIFLIAYLTADLSAQNTVQQLQGSIGSVDDLPGKRIATVEGTTAAEYLREQRLIFTPLTSIEEGYALLEEGDIDALVYDSPVLIYYANVEARGEVTVVGPLFERQDYGIALPTGSPLREDIDRALLEILEDGIYDEIYERWFGQVR
ncbi:MAG: transporter substrate-binding domain-containing protein [Anaerolineae bacterium]|nr:transporter substrate-binding domain-containing protein [Anaerolineae bacterium]